MQYYKNNEIDKYRWDLALEKLHPKLIYAQSFYLDTVTKNQWGAYISKNYNILIPVHFSHRLGVKRLVQPLFTQQLGIFSKTQLSTKETEQILTQITSKPRVVVYQINSNNKLHSIYGSDVTNRVTYTLDLSPDFDTLKKAFSKSNKKNIKIAQNREQIIKTISVDELIDLAYAKRKHVNLKAKHIHLLKKLITQLHEKKLAYLKGTVHEGKLCTAGAWIKTDTRIYYLYGVSNEIGMKLRSMFLLQNHILKEMASSNIIYDFEGSMIPGVASFFAGFGATPETYQLIEKNTVAKAFRKLF